MGSERVARPTIHWSTAMERAWKAITELPRVGVALDLHRVGVCAFR